MKTHLHHLVPVKIVSYTISEKIFFRYTEELYPKVKKIGVFDQNKERLEEFFFQNPNFSLSSEIQSVIKLVLVFSHDQTSVEHGFDINKSVNKVNISQDSVIARKLTIDHMQRKGLEPLNIELSSQLIRSVKASRKRYSVYLEEQKKIKK